MSNPSFKSAWVGLIGPTNAGKSTLLNRLVGDKVAIVSPKPQTTRHAIKGIYTDTECQLVFCDTPGLHAHAGLLNEEMKKLAFDTAGDMDILCLVLEAQRPEWQWLLPFAAWKRCPCIVLLNKADLLGEADRQRVASECVARGLHFPCLFVSALNGEGCDTLVTTLKAMSKPGPRYYTEDELTDRPWRFLAAEIIREKCFLLLGEEIPYGIGVVIDDFKEEKIVKIRASLIVNRESHKGMVIGKGGAMLKKIGQLAREELEVQLGHKLFLELFVRVEKNWIKDSRKIREFVYFD
jgi:GTP-binding protein Era